MNARTATSIVAIGLLGAGFAAFVLVAGDARTARGQRAAEDVARGRGSGPAGAGADAPGADAPWSRGSDVASAAGDRHAAAAGEGSARAGADPASGGDGAGDPVERVWGDEVTEGMRKLLRDLEYTKGLPEPPQQLVQPQPEPWRRDPTREGPPPEITGVSPRRGRVAGGERVEIRGRNLRVVSVMFGASPARLLAATDALVTVEAPAGSPGPASIALTNEDGTWGVAAEPYMYGE